MELVTGAELDVLAFEDRRALPFDDEHSMSSVNCDARAMRFDGWRSASATGETVITQLKAQGWEDNPYAIDGIPIKREKDGVHFELKKGELRICGYVSSLKASRLKGDAFHFNYGIYNSDKGHCMEWEGI